MSEFTITGTILESHAFTIEYVDEAGYTWSHSMPWGNLEILMAEYGLDDPGHVLQVLLHDPHMWKMINDGAAKDDPAAVSGWVTTSDPDAETVTLFNARSTADARGAHLARVAAVQERGVATFSDPDGHLATVLSARPLDIREMRRYREHVDTIRWGLVYGDLPEAPRNPLKEG